MNSASAETRATTGRQLRAARLRAKLRGPAVAAQMKVPHQRVYALEGQRVVTAEAAARYLAAVDTASAARDGHLADPLSGVILKLAGLPRHD